jgi:hypothetical protein
MIALPKLVPATAWNSLSLAIASGNTNRVQKIVEEGKLDVNACVDTTFWMPVLMEALLSYGFASEPDRLPLLKYLLDKGANPNIICSRGYNCLHIAAQQDRYIDALDLMLDYDADVNITDSDGSNIVYWTVQGWLLRREGADRSAYLRVLAKLLRLGADLDLTNRYGMNTRRWIEASSADVQDLVSRWEASQPRAAVHAVTTVQPAFPVNLRYPELVREIWDQYVPASGGPAPTVQGELLRAVEHLRDEAHHQAAGRRPQSSHRKANKRQALFVRDTLLASGCFDPMESDRIRTHTQRLIRPAGGAVSDAVYDELVDKVCVFYSKHKEPIPL